MIEMLFSIPAVVFTLLTVTTAAPIQDAASSGTIVTQSKTILVHAAPPAAVVSKIAEPEPRPGTVILIPPPLFDPPEPRPDPLYNSGNVHAQANLKSAPIQESRTETLLPFDGAHVHPYATPYTPEALPGTCAFYTSCRVMRTTAEIGITLIVLFTAIYVVFFTLDKIIRRVIWSAKTRARSPSGSLRLEPEVGSKVSESQQFSSESEARKTPLVKVISEKGLERIVHLV